MRYPVTLVPRSAIRPDLGLTLRMRPKGSTTPGKTDTVTIHDPAPCVSIFAGYSAAGEVDSAPGYGPNVVFFRCPGSGAVTVTAHGIFCPADVFDWRVIVVSGLGSVTTIEAGTVVSGNPTIGGSWLAAVCDDPASMLLFQLRKNGLTFGPIFEVGLPAPPCADIATLPGGGVFYAVDTTTGVHFDITLLAGYTSLTPSDLTWDFQTVGPTPVDVAAFSITADGPAVSDGFTLHADPSLNTAAPGDLYGTGVVIRLSVSGVFNCTLFEADSDSLTMIFDPSSSGVTQTGDTTFQVNHADPSFSLVLLASKPSVGGGVAVTWTIAVTGPADPDFSVSPTGTSTANPATVSGMNIGGADPIQVQISVVENADAGNFAPHSGFPATVDSV